MMKISFFCSIILMSYILTSCQNKKEENMNNKVDNTGSNSGRVNIFWNSNKDYTYEQKDQFKKDNETAKEKLNNKIDELQRIAGNTRGNASIKCDKSVKDLKEEREYLNKKMSDFNEVTQDNWNDFKSGINSVWDEIDDTWESTNTD